MHLYVYLNVYLCVVCTAAVGCLILSTESSNELKTADLSELEKRMFIHQNLSEMFILTKAILKYPNVFFLAHKQILHYALLAVPLYYIAMSRAQ